MNRRYPFFLFCYLLITYHGCLPIRNNTTAEIPWPEPHPDFEENFRIYVEPGTDPTELRNVLGTLKKVQTSMIGTYFPAHRKSSITLILYKDEQSYTRHTGTANEIFAHYNRFTKSIHIPLSAGLATWKHELAHALLESVRPGTDYWLHEGFALFVENQEFQGKIKCSRKNMASMPTRIAHLLNDLREKRKLNPGINSETQDEIHTYDTGLAGYFVFFLWNTGRLTQLLKRYQNNPELSAEFILTRGKIHTWRKMETEFRNWILSNKPLRSLPGC